MPDQSRSSIWTRAVADPAFREILVDDPLRALAGAHDLEVSPDQVRSLEAMSREEREDLLRELVRDVASHKAREQWGDRFWSPDEEPPPGS